MTMTTTDEPAGMRQEAPYPAILQDLVGRLRYREHEGWRYWLVDMDRGQGSQGLTLVVLRVGPDSYHPEHILRVQHLFPVPPAAYDRRSWRRWLFERLHDVEIHELMENFVLVDEEHASPGCACGINDAGTRYVDPLCKRTERRPYAPSHGPGNDPYLIREPDGTDLDRRTSFRGEVDQR